MPETFGWVIESSPSRPISTSYATYFARLLAAKGVGQGATPGNLLFEGSEQPKTKEISRKTSVTVLIFSGYEPTRHGHNHQHRVTTLYELLVDHTEW